MSGFLQVNAYTSDARFPLKDTAVSVTDTNGDAIAIRLTNRSGQFDAPIEIQVPDADASLSPDPEITPFRVVNLYAKLENFEEIEVKNVQVFSDVLTVQNLALIPQSELPEYWNQVEIFQTPQQNL